MRSRERSLLAVLACIMALGACNAARKPGGHEPRQSHGRPVEG